MTVMPGVGHNGRDVRGRVEDNVSPGVWLHAVSLFGPGGVWNGRRAGGAISIMRNKRDAPPLAIFRGTRQSQAGKWYLKVHHPTSIIFVIVRLVAAPARCREVLYRPGQIPGCPVPRSCHLEIIAHSTS